MASTTLTFNNNVYEYVSGKLTFEQALVAAAARSYNGVQGHLVTLTSVAENKAVYDAFRPYLNYSTYTESASAWIAASDKAVEGTWKWMAGPETGQSLSFTGWIGNEPNNLGNEDYAVLHYANGWYDISNEVYGGQSYIVEYENAARPHTISVSAASFSTVEQAANGTVIGTVNAVDSYGDALSYFIRSGNVDVDGDGKGAFAINPSTGVITVNDAGDLNYTRLNKFDLIVQASDGALSSTGAITVNVTRMLQPYTGPVKATYDKNVYEYFGDRLTFDQALAAAATKSYNGIQGHLVTFTSLDEHVAVYNAFSPYLDYRSYGESAAAWIAASDQAVEGRWVWVAGPEAGKALTFTKWAGQEPNDIGGEDYAVLHFVNGWFDMPKTGWYDPQNIGGYSYIVEYENANQTIVPKSPPKITPKSPSQGFDFIAIPENWNTSVTVYKTIAVDPDSPKLTYSISGTDARLFSINADTGDVYFKASPNYEMPNDADKNNGYSFIVQASDGTSSDSREVLIAVNDVTESYGPKYAFNGNVYHYISGRVTFDQAVKFANEAIYNGIKGHIVTIETAEEHNAVWSFFRSFIDQAYYGGSARYWIGGSDAGSQGNWIWTQGPNQGKAWGFSNWASGHPTTKTGFDYAIIDDSGFWSDVSGMDFGSILIEYEGAASGKSASKAPYKVNIAQLAVSEGTEKTTELSIEIIRPISSGAESLSWWTTGATGAGLASAEASDFVKRTMPGGQIDFASSETTKTITISIKGDCVYEKDEFFNLYLGSDTGNSYSLTLNAGSGSTDYISVQIVNDDSINSNLRFDISGNAGKAYRLYEAALDRAPDCKGLASWIKYLDDGNSLKSMAEQFIASQEFSAKYGPLNDQSFVNQLYLNVLERDGEASGINGWVNGLASGLVRADVLVGFSESPENKTAIDPTIRDGVVYWQWWLD